MTFRVKVVKVDDRTSYDEWGDPEWGVVLTGSNSEWVELSQKEYIELQDSIRWANLQLSRKKTNSKFQIVQEQEDNFLEEVKETAKEFHEEIDKQRKLEEKKKREDKKKREAAALKRKQKQLEKLKKELEG